MPLIINGNCKKGALFYYFWLRRIFPEYQGRIRKRNGNGEKQKQKAISVLRPTLLYLVTVALRC